MHENKTLRMERMINRFAMGFENSIMDVNEHSRRFLAMKRARFISLVVFLIVISSGTLLFAQDSSSRDPSAAEIVGDVLWVRPLGFIGTAAKALTYVITLPIAKSLNREEEAKEFLIEDPYYYYFKRPLGEY